MSVIAEKTAKHMQVHKSGYLLGLLPLVVAMGSMMTYLHVNFASASDLQRVEDKIDKGYVLSLKKYIRELKMYQEEDPNNEFIEEELETTLDELCEMRPHARECNT